MLFFWPFFFFPLPVPRHLVNGPSEIWESYDLNYHLPSWWDYPFNKHSLCPSTYQAVALFLRSFRYFRVSRPQKGRQKSIWIPTSTPAQLMEPCRMPYVCRFLATNEPLRRTSNLLMQTSWILTSTTKELESALASTKKELENALAAVLNTPLERALSLSFSLYSAHTLRHSTHLSFCLSFFLSLSTRRTYCVTQHISRSLELALLRSLSLLSAFIAVLNISLVPIISLEI